MNLNPTTVQSILFDKSKWNLRTSKAWLKKHKKEVPIVDETENYLRFRQIDPIDFKKDSFRTISFGHKRNGILAVIGELKKCKTCKKNPLENTMQIDGITLVYLIKELNKESKKVKTFKAKCNKIRSALAEVNQKLGIRPDAVSADDFRQDYPDGDSADVCVFDSAVGTIALIQPKGKVAKVHYMAIGEHSAPQIEYDNEIYSAVSQKELSQAMFEVEPDDILAYKMLREGDFRDYFAQNKGITQEMLDKKYGLHKLNPRSAKITLEMPQILVHNPPKKISDLESFYANVKQGNIFAGSSIIVVTDDGLKRLDGNGKMYSVSVPVALYVDLAGDAYLVGNAKELEEVRKIRKDDLKNMYDSALKYLKGSIGETIDIEEPEEVVGEVEETETETEVEVDKKDVEKVLSADVLNIFNIAKEESKKKNEVTFDNIAVSEMLAQLDKDEMKKVKTALGYTARGGFGAKKALQVMVEQLTALLDTKKSEREEKDRLEKERLAEEERQRKAEEERLKKEKAKKEKEKEKETKSKDVVSEVIDQINAMIKNAREGAEIELPDSLAKKIDDNKDLFAKSISVLMVGKRDKAKDIATKGSKPFKTLLKNVGGLIKSATYKGEDVNAFKESIMIQYKPAKPTAKKPTGKKPTATNVVADVVNKINAMIDKAKEGEEIELPDSLAKKIDDNKELFSKSISVLMVGKRDKAKDIATKGSKPFKTLLKNIGGLIKGATYKGEDIDAFKQSIKISLSNPSNRSYIYPMSVRDHNHRMDVFDMYSNKPIPNPKRSHNYAVDGIGDWENVLAESFDRVLKSKPLPKSFFDLFTLIDYAKAPHLSGADKDNFDTHRTELLNMFGDISTAVEVHYDPEKLEERIYGLNYMGDSYFKVPKKEIDRWEIIRFLNPDNYYAFHEHLRFLDYYLKDENNKRNPRKNKRNPRKNALQPFQEPQVDIDGTMIDADIYDFFGDVYGYKLLIDELEDADDDDEIEEIQDDLEVAGDLIIEAQTVVVPNLEEKFNEYIDDGGKYPLPKSNPYGRFARYY